MKYIIGGLGNGALYFSVYYCLLCAGVNYLMANGLSWAVGVLYVFFWNRRYVFSFHGVWWKGLFKTYVSYSVSLVVGLVLLFLLVEAAGVSEVWAPWMTLIVTIPLNFALNKFWTFARQ